ncbi:MAG: hypothetical protein K2J15_01940, partial [Muribaculaceae bacterium]|nr:hypothetical protein [Muribaculaceae bacterium]
TELISRQLGGIPVRTGRLPAYVHLDDTKGPSSEIIEVASVLYAGATLTEASCLREPSAEDLPVIGTAPEDDDFEDERPERKRESGSSLKFVNKLRSGISRLFSDPEKEDSGLLE